MLLHTQWGLQLIFLMIQTFLPLNFITFVAQSSNELEFCLIFITMEPFVVPLFETMTLWYGYKCLNFIDHEETLRHSAVFLHTIALLLRSSHLQTVQKALAIDSAGPCSAVTSRAWNARNALFLLGWEYDFSPSIYLTVQQFTPEHNEQTQFYIIYGSLGTFESSEEDVYLILCPEYHSSSDPSHHPLLRLCALYLAVSVE